MFDPKSLADSIVSGDDPEALAVGEMPAEGEANDEELAAEDVMAAFQANDPKALASALRSFFEVVDAKPHTEGGEEPTE